MYIIDYLENKKGTFNLQYPNEASFNW